MIDIVEFLEKRDYLANEFATLLAEIHPHGVVLLKHVAQVLRLLDPWEGIPIQLDRKNIFCFLRLFSEDEALSFGFDRIHISAELKVLGGGKILTKIHHSLESSSAGRDKKKVVSIAKTTQEYTRDVATKVSFPQDHK